MRGPLESDVADALALMAAAGRPPFETLTVAEARALYRAGRDTVQLATVDVARVEDIALGGRPARLYRPEATGADDAVILFFHGGGFVIGDLDTHDSICRHLARAAATEVIALDYRLAPEHPFPAAFEDCHAAYAALAAGGRAIALAGDSAGGALVAAVAVAARDGGLRLPRAMALFYPVADLAAEASSYDVTDVAIGAETMRWFWRHYLPDGGAAADWRASPLRADLAGLPRAFVSTCGHDPLHDEGDALASALRAAGGEVVHRDLPGQIHGYLTLGRLIGEAERSLAAAGVFLRDHLREPAASPE